MNWWIKSILVTVCALDFLTNQAYAFPSSHDHLHGQKAVNKTHPFDDFGAISSKRADKIPLRILSLGASIMSGTGSSTGNGKPLRDALRYDGWEVNMVGTRGTGTMQDWNYEAVPGYVLTQIRTNDGNKNINPTTAGERMNDILDDIWGADGMSKTCVMLSTLLDTNDANGQVLRLTINTQYRKLVTERAAEGKCIYLADMDPLSPDPAHGWINTWDDYDSSETIHVHPNDEGHRKMAYVFYKAINKAVSAEKIVESEEFTAGTTTCDKFEGSGEDAGGYTQRGSGNHDGIYYHDSKEMGMIWTADSEWDRDQWRFARLFSQDYDDFVAWIKDDSSNNHFAVWANSADGEGSFSQVDDMNPNYYCDPSGLYFIDMNADGLDDFVCIAANGDAYLSINQGDGDRASKKPPTFKSLGKIKSNEGSKRDHIVMADIDGDGRGDYGVVDDDGNVQFWRNGWVNDTPDYWQALGLRLSDRGLGSYKGVRFEDINGDGRDDGLWVGEEGETYTWTNSRSCKRGSEGNGLNVAWRQGFYSGQSSGATHKGMGSYVTDDESNLRDRIHFARIYGEKGVFGNLPLQDYIFLEHEELSSGKHRFNMRVWKNTGGGGSKIVADGNKYCNMVGHEDGRVDYVWTQSTGAMQIYINRGKGTISDSDADGYWDYSTGTIWTPPSNMDRRDLHLQDWDGDGSCDIIYVNPDTNAVEVFINKYPETGKWEWTHISNPAPGLTCKYKRGLGIFDLSVRFADITGNSRADYLCIAPDGTVNGYLQQDDGSFDNAGQIKVSVEKDRANLRWADVDGDGLDDMLWIEKFSGDTWVWYNGGRGDPSTGGGSSFYWRVQDDKAYHGLVAGTCIYYTDLDGNGHADEHYVLETFTNKAKTSLNPSCGLMDREGDDDGGVVNPALPVQPSNGSDDDSDDGSSDDDDDDSSGDHTDYIPDPSDDNPLPSCTDSASYTTFDEIEAHAGSIDMWCGPQYSITILLQLLKDTLDRYDEIMADGYDHYFNVYSEYVVGNAYSVLQNYMLDHGDEFFDCKITEEYTCCNTCKFEDISCQWCAEECDIDSPYDDGHGWGNFSEPCPPDYSERGMNDNDEKTIFWTLRDDTKDDFWTDVTAEVGAPENRLPITARQQIGTLSSSCAREAVFNGEDKMSKSCYYTKFWYNAPTVDGFVEDDVVNPKETVGQALANTQPLIDQLSASLFEIMAFTWEADPEDIVDSVAMSIFLIRDSVDLMEEVVEMAKELEEADKKSLILNLLSALFFVIPALGSTLASLGLTTLGRAFVWIGEGANIGMGIYDMVGNPNAIPLDIFGIILSVKGIRDVGNARKAATARRGMSDVDISAISTKVAKNLDQISMLTPKMGGWDVFCAICGGPLGELHWGQGKDAEYGYEPDVLESPEDPELAWVKDIRLIGENPETEAPCKFRAQQPVGNTASWTTSQETTQTLLCLGGAKSTFSHLDKETFFETLHSLATEHDGSRCLDIDYGDVTERMDQYWDTQRETEHYVFNPVEVKGLKSYLANLPKRSVSIDGQVMTHNTKGDPFATLPPDILMIIIANLKKMATVFKLRRASPAFANLEFSNTFWRNRLQRDMLWLWDLPSPMTSQQRNETDWQLVYRKLYWGSKPLSKKENKIYGLCNRRRIWEQLCPIFAEAYLEYEARLEELGAVTPIVLKGAFTPKSKQLVESDPADTRHTTRTLIDRFSDLSSASPLLLVDWARNGELADIRISKQNDAAEREKLNISLAKTDKVSIPQSDWLTGFKITSRISDEGDACERRQLVGVEVLFARQLPVRLGSNDGDQRLIYVTKDRFVVALDIHRSSTGFMNRIDLIEQPLVHAYGCLRVVDTLRENYNMRAMAHLWRRELPQPTIRLSKGTFIPWGSCTEEQLHPLEVLMFGKSDEGLADIKSVSVDIQLGGFEISYGDHASRTLGPRLYAMKTLEIDGRGGERIIHISPHAKSDKGVIFLQLVTNRGRVLLVGESDVWRKSTISSDDHGTRLMPCGIYGYWRGSELTKYLGGIGVVGSTTVGFNGINSGPPCARDGNQFPWEPSMLPSELEETGTIWGGGVTDDSEKWTLNSENVGNGSPTVCTAPISAITLRYTDGKEATVGPNKFPLEPTCGWCTSESSIEEEVRTVPHYRHQTWQVGDKRLTSLRIWRPQVTSMAAIQLVAEGQSESPIWGHWGYDVADSEVSELRFAGEGGGDAIGLKFFFHSNGRSGQGDNIIAGIQALKATS
ncbi:hypothetical protein G7Z17_g5812 [Cylindrodendrum hubeiense]|uniref:F-box domain-containing protein n=1 Tax=Cylindrodendrum hubeiense TaxID=595255 RepID=A0A9P5HA77_9HYPO|nr:hypothetical protein G7Z17_g5812 [Cylindrodendrum hubeiense]